jgi:hypothetical protein
MQIEWMKSDGRRLRGAVNLHDEDKTGQEDAEKIILNPVQAISFLTLNDDKKRLRQN